MGPVSSACSRLLLLLTSQGSHNRANLSLILRRLLNHSERVGECRGLPRKFVGRWSADVQGSVVQTNSRSVSEHLDSGSSRRDRLDLAEKLGAHYVMNHSSPVASWRRHPDTRELLTPGNPPGATSLSMPHSTRHHFHATPRSRSCFTTCCFSMEGA